MARFGSLVLSILSRWLIQFYLYLSLTSCIPEISSSFLMTSLLILSSLVYPVTLLLYLSKFRKLSRKFKFHCNRTRITGTAHEDEYMITITCRSFILRMRNVSNKRVKEKQNTYFVFRNFSRKSCSL